jgi:hypothetical protein
MLQVKPLGDSIVAATVDIYRVLSEQLLPTPSKSHYLFNTRDLSKIVQGLSQVRGMPLTVPTVVAGCASQGTALSALRCWSGAAPAGLRTHHAPPTAYAEATTMLLLPCCAATLDCILVAPAHPGHPNPSHLSPSSPPQANKALYNGREDLLALWCHETLRVVADRMWDTADVAWVKKQLADKLSSALGSSWDSLFEQDGGEVGSLQHAGIASVWQCLAMSGCCCLHAGRTICCMLRSLMGCHSTCSKPSPSSEHPLPPHPPPTQVPPYVNFLKAGLVDVPPYEPVHDMPALKELLATKLEDLAMEPGHRAMDLVLFRCGAAGAAGGA